MLNWYFDTLWLFFAVLIRESDWFNRGHNWVILTKKMAKASPFLDNDNNLLTESMQSFRFLVLGHSKADVKWKKYKTVCCTMCVFSYLTWSTPFYLAHIFPPYIYRSIFCRTMKENIWIHPPIIWLLYISSSTLFPSRYLGILTKITQ